MYLYEQELRYGVQHSLHTTHGEDGGQQRAVVLIICIFGHTQCSAGARRGCEGVCGMGVCYSWQTLLDKLADDPKSVHGAIRAHLITGRRYKLR